MIIYIGISPTEFIVYVHLQTLVMHDQCNWFTLWPSFICTLNTSCLMSNVVTIYPTVDFSFSNVATWVLPYEIGRYVPKTDEHWKILLAVVEGLLHNVVPHFYMHKLRIA